MLSGAGERSADPKLADGHLAVDEYEPLQRLEKAPAPAFANLLLAIPEDDAELVVPQFDSAEGVRALFVTSCQSPWPVRSYPDPYV